MDKKESTAFMKKRVEIFLLPPLLPSVTIVQHIQFSTREIDILTCLLECRSTKKIASVLNLSPRTVENYIHGLTTKIECNSRDGIIDFIEQSDQFPWLQDHYKLLQVQAEFDRTLKHIATLNTPYEREGMLLFEEEVQSYSLSSFQSHLKKAGFHIIAETLKNTSSKDIQSSKVTFLIYILSDTTVKKLQNGQSLSSLLPSSSYTPETVIYICFENAQAPKSAEDYQYIQEENYYFSVLNILKKTLPLPQVDSLAWEFRKKYAQIMGSSHEFCPSHEVNHITEQKNVDQGNNSLLSFVPQIFFNTTKRSAFIFLGIFILLSVGVYKIQTKPTGINLKPSIVSSLLPQLQQGINPIRSDLLLPAEDVLLERPLLMAQVEEAFKDPKPIRLVALSGVGGAGKTILARKIARTQPAPLIWEVNAETKESLTGSFEDLAQALAKTEEEKKYLKDVQEAQSPEAKHNKILHFVKERLKEQPNWFLLYDNVENLSDIRPYLPQDANTWGQGKVLITTQDSHIQNNKSIHVIPVDMLTPDEKAALFTKILGTDTSSSVKSTTSAETKQLLEDIPPFPLDVSIAAYYLKTTQVSPETYRQHLLTPNPDFIAVQENILQETGEYFKTWGEPHGLDQKSLKLSFSV